MQEENSHIVDQVFEEAEHGSCVIGFALFNIGETLDVFIKKYNKKELNEKNLQNVVPIFTAECLKLFKLNALQILPFTLTMQVDSWLYSLKHKIYNPDSLQIATAKSFNADSFLSFDKGLKKIAQSEGLNLFPT